MLKMTDDEMKGKKSTKEKDKLSLLHLATVDHPKTSFSQWAGTSSTKKLSPMSDDLT